MSKLIIEIFKENELIDTRQGVSAKSGKPWKQFSQIAYAHLGGKFPVETKIPLEEGQPHYIAGKYELHMKSFLIGDFDKLSVGRDMLLIPVDGKAF